MNDVLLFDGHCRFCKKSAIALKAQTHGELTLTSFREIDPTQYGITFEACEKKLHLIFDGRVEAGVGAIVQALRKRWYGVFLKVLLLPGIRAVAEAIYMQISKRRFKLAGGCSDGNCTMYQ
jgi:predicted DCC family thiol-disulfide oxidoreductase YuxK